MMLHWFVIIFAVAPGQSAPRQFPPEILETPLPPPSIDDWQAGPPCKSQADCSAPRACVPHLSQRDLVMTRTCEVSCAPGQASGVCPATTECVALTELFGGPKTAGGGVCLSESADGHARRLVISADSKLRTRDFQGAVDDARAALAQHPARRAIQCQAYRALGYGYAYLNDKTRAVEWLGRYQSCISGTQ